MVDKQENLIDKVKNFFQTKQGRVVSIAAATGVLVAILVIVFVSILKGGGSEDQVKAINNTPPKSAAVSNSRSANKNTENSTATDSHSGNEGEDLNSNFEVYQTRDPFKPITKVSTESVSLPPQSLSPATNTSGTVNSTTTPAPAKLSLLLKSIVTRDGINFAVIDYGGTSYELKAGDQVGGSPYQVQEIGSDNATLLYGDNQFTLNVGQEVYK